MKSESGNRKRGMNSAQNSLFRAQRRSQSTAVMGCSRKTALMSWCHSTALLLFASATLTTSLPPSAQSSAPQTIYQGGMELASRYTLSTLAPTSEAQDTVSDKSDKSMDMVIQMSLISVKGSLAFWHHTDLSQEDLLSVQRQYQLGIKKTSSSSPPPQLPPVISRPSVSPISTNIKCLQLAGLNHPQQSPKSLSISTIHSTTGAVAEPASEIVAVEGTSIKFNLVIIGHRFAGAPLSSLNEPMSQKLQLYWSKNGEPVATNSAKARLSQQLINENNIIKQFFGQRSNSALGGVNQQQQQRSSFHNLSSLSKGYMEHSSHHPQMSLESVMGNFMLAPHLNERLINNNRLTDNNHNNLIDAKIVESISSKRSTQSLNLVDDFIADYQSIDWQKLETYLRFNSAQLGLYLPSNDVEKECTNMQAKLEQLTIVQVDISHLTMRDAGLYQLNACAKRDDTDNENGNQHAIDSHQRCQKYIFTLQVTEDVPILISKPEHLILEVDDKLSIKCEATGFTLPQITWFLDGQQLNEHQLATSVLANHDHHLDSSIAGSMANNQLRLLRVGDYVSQDNHVHSFVNSSQVQITDGGFYKCQANNGFHTVEHESRIDVHGPPIIARSLNNMSVLVGQSQLHIQCPYSGYPITSIEWYYRPSVSLSAKDQQSSNVVHHQKSSSSSFMVMPNGSGFDYSGIQLGSLGSGRQLARARRRPEEEGGGSDGSSILINNNYPPSLATSFGANLVDTFSNANSESFDSDKDSDPDNDEWLSQASAMTPSSSEEYPDPLPDYPPPSLIPLSDYYDTIADSLAPDYNNVLMDIQQQHSRRKKRAITEQWVKFPQSRRHQIHLNGTLIIQDVSRSDQGFYKCRVIATSSSGTNSANNNNFDSIHGNKQQLDSAIQHDDGNGEAMHVASSNEFYLTVLVPPVISPFASADSLREGMRNFLTCSVIEGDSPVKLSWLKDGQPIEEYIERTLLVGTQEQPPSDPQLWNQNQHQQQARIRVETNNEYTSTLYFSHVDFKDNGNYTCMATNKAASVNYTARMLVNVPPKWIKSPKDLESVSGQNIVIDCQAQAHPNPRVWWEIGVYSLSTSSLSDFHHQQATNKETNKNKARISVELAPLSNSNNYNINVMMSNQQNHPPNHYRTIISNSRIHILENASLVIRDVNKLDQGYYLCQAANNFGSLSSLIKLTVNVGASFSSKYLVKYVKLNEKIELDCDPIGQSPVDITWHMRHFSNAANQLNHTSSNTNNHLHHMQTNQSSLESSFSTKIQQNGQQEQSTGQHHDKLNSLGRRLFTGTIRTELQLHHLKPQDIMQSAVSSSSGYLSPQTSDQMSPRRKLNEIQFESQTAEKNKNQLDSSSSSASLSTMSFDFIKRSDGQSEFVRLLIKQAKRHHSADYICQASNRYGSEEKLIKLLVQEAPDPVQEMSAVQVDSRSVSITWQAPYNGNSPISSYTVEWASLGSPGKWSHMMAQQPACTISPLQPMTSYEIRIRAHNQFGESSLSSNSIGQNPPMIITTIEEAPSAPPSDIRVTPLSSSSLQLTWLPPVVVPTDGALIEDSISTQTNTVITKSNYRYSIKGYYLGYKIANSNESFVFKTVSLLDPGLPSNLEDDHLLATSELQMTNNSSGQIKSLINASNSTTNDNNSRRLRVVIGDLKRSTKYAIIVQAFNSAGPGPQSDQIEAKTLINDPPPAPLLRVGLVTYTSIELQWSFQIIDPINQFESVLTTSSLSQQVRYSSISETTVPPKSLEDIQYQPKESAVDGYSIYYRSALDAQWAEKKLSAETHTIITTNNHQRNDLSIIELSNEKSSSITSNEKLTVVAPLSWHKNSSSLAFRSFRFVLDQLICGTSYQIYLIAYNPIGSGLPSQIVRTKTRGSAPIAPRKQDFILINSTYVQLNFDSWMDGGCSITNFEIKYKQLNSRAGSSQVGVNNGENNNNQQWLMLSSEVSPEQHMIELRDLQPETWYSVLTTAESAAGKTELQYSFMTLDKFGQIPAEAREVANNLPALFKTSGSIGFILHNFSSGSNLTPLVMSASMCLLLFATCSLFLIRKYNSQMKDSVSMDSQTTSGALSSHYHHGPMSDIMDHSAKLMGSNRMSNVYGAPNQEQYSMKASPCKTTTATSSSTNGSSVAIMGGSSLCNDNHTGNLAAYHRTNLDQSVNLNQFTGSGTGSNNDPQHAHCIHPQFRSSTLTHHHQQQQPLDEFCLSRCELPMSPSKFANLARENIINNLETKTQQQQQPSRFKTMPHSNNRPVSSFIPCTNYQGVTSDSTRFIYNGNQQQQQQQQQQQVQRQSQNDFQEHLADQQQIYSKLRLIYNTDSNNLRPDSRKTVNPNENTDQIYNDDTINLAVLAPKNQKIISCSLAKGNQQQHSLYMMNGCGGQTPDGNPDELTSLLIDRQQHHQTQTVDSSNNDNSNDNNYGQYQMGQQFINNVMEGPQAETTNGYNAYGAPSIAAGSTSTSKSSSSMSNNNNADQLINIAAIGNSCGILNQNGTLNHSTGQCSKANQMNIKVNVNAVGQPNSQNITQQQAGHQPTNESNDYALPFLPKWV